MGLDDKFMLAVKGETLPKNAITKLDKELAKRIAALEDSRPARRAAAETQLEKDVAALRDSATAAMEPHRKKVNTERDAIREEYLVQIEKLQDLKDPIKDDQCTLLPESDLREWNERYPGLVKAGMGAEALLGILERVELDPLKEKLKGEIQNFSGQRRKKATKRLRVVESLRM
jgi:DNA-directed RNA polymerase subunit beta'